MLFINKKHNTNEFSKIKPGKRTVHAGFSGDRNFSNDHLTVFTE